ncbi:hypothetical protein G6M14_08580 [Agrobacterium tumefaciens]|uniref:hypothetical protein n=1 Tax=Agrobacterium tumefaciens TaxID=358 RepID=UPI001571E85D|nr:hypothetical protein [Agrobacterium tumefaciens]
MPSVPDEFIPLRATGPQEPAAAQEDAGFMETLGAAGVRNNWPYRAWRYASNRADVTYDPDYDPFSEIRGTKYEADPQRFSFSRSAAETQAIMREWDADEGADDVLSRSGWSGTVASIGMGMLDPTIFLPVAKVFSGIAQGQRALRIGADVALTGGASAAVGEAVMYGTTPEYTVGDAALGVGTATALSGFLGAGAGALLSRGERKALEQKFHADRENWGASISGQPQSAGAAAADTRQLQLNTPSVLQKLPDVTAKVSPPRRVLNSGFLAARRALVDLVETPYIFRENVEGVATTQGPALDRLAKLETGKVRVAMSQTFDRLYWQYRAGTDNPGRMQRLKTGAADLTGRSSDGKATFSEWKNMVDDALRNGDAHEIPQVAEAAKFVRETVLSPWRDRAIKAGLLPDDVDVKTADSYMMRVWNKQKLIADRPNVMKTFADWLEGEQAKKAQSRDRIAGNVDLKEAYASAIDDLEAKISARVDKMEADILREAEMNSLNKFSHQRANRLREAIQEMDEAAERRLLDRARGGAVFETKVRSRQNQLADRISGLDAEVDDLTRRLADMQAKHDRIQADIERDISSWDGKSSTEAKAALKARTKAEADRQARMDASLYQGQGGRMISADSAVNAAVRRILARGDDRTRQELESLANEIIDRIVGGPDGRLPYDAPTGGPRGGVPAGNADARGALAHRNFMIPDNLVRDWLETDVQQVSEIYLNTMVPDVLLTERFGDTDMTEVFRRLNEEASARELAAKSEKERLQIRAEKNAVEADLAAMRDRIRHVYGHSSDPRMRLMGRVAATAARYDIVTNLGGAALSSLADMAGLQWRHGFATTFKSAWAPMLKSLTNRETRAALGKYRQQMQALGIAAETYLSTRTSGVYDVLDVYKPTSRFERATSVMADKFGLASMLTPWTDFGKFAAGMVGGSELSRAAEAIAAGKGSARQIRNMAEAGIDSVMAGRIWKELSAEGGSDIVDGLRLPNTGNWKDEGARAAFEGALARDVDIMILTPGAEKPLMMSNPIMALVLQYKTFVVAANERILVRGLQARDAQVLQGLASAIALGAMAELAYTVAANREGPKNPSDWVKAGINRSGILGWYSEGNSILAKWTGGTADAYRLIGASQPDARYISRSPGGALLGPTFGKAETTVKSMSTLIAKVLGGDVDWKESDTTNMRRLIAGQNLFYIRRLLDSGEDQVNEWLGVEPRQ